MLYESFSLNREQSFAPPQPFVPLLSYPFTYQASPTHMARQFTTSHPHHPSEQVFHSELLVHFAAPLLSAKKGYSQLVNPLRWACPTLAPLFPFSKPPWYFPLPLPDPTCPDPDDNVDCTIRARHESARCSNSQHHYCMPPHPPFIVTKGRYHQKPSSPECPL